MIDYLKAIPFLVLIVQALCQSYNYSPCHQDCLTCKGPSYKDCGTCAITQQSPYNSICCGSQCKCNGSICVDCSSGYILRGGICVKLTKPDGYYIDYQDNIQKKCISNCNECYASSDTCEQCASRYIQDPSKQCILVCTDTNCIECDTSQICKKCKPNFIVSNRQCVDYSYYECLQCPVGCSQCSDQNTCTECDPNLQLVNQMCVEITQCEQSCKTCKQINSNQCTSCSAGYDKGTVNTSDPQTFSCLQTCHPSCQSCKGFADTNCNTCPTGYVLIQIDQSNKTGKCLPCPLNCDQCQENRTCTQCKQGFNIVNGSCEPQNQQNFYAECKQCPSNCVSCYGEFACYECEQGYVVDLLTGLCKQSEQKVCPKTTYGDGKGSCASCSLGCAKCNGPNKQDCSLCLNGSNDLNQCYPDSCKQTLTFFVVNQSECVTNCPNETYLDTATRVCEKCVMGQYFSTNNNSCQDCRSGCFSCSSSADCLVCKNGFVGDDCKTCPLGKFMSASGLCKFCDAKCLTCQDNAFNCTACRGEQRQDITQGCNCLNGYFDNFGGIATKDCSLSMCQIGYQTSPTSPCLACNPSCKSCSSDKEDACYTCSDSNKFNWRGLCLDKCPFKTVEDKSKSQYICKYGQSQEQDYCTDSTYYDQNVQHCVVCIDNCIKCSSSTVCDMCKVGYKLLNAKCVPQVECNLSTYKNIQGICLPCSLGCAQCNSPEENECFKCFNGIQFQCLPQPSCQGQFVIIPDQAQCQSECPLTLFLDTYTRVCQKCKMSEYYDETSQKCSKCQENCLSCSSLNTCFKCKDGLEGNKCIQPCPLGQFRDSNNNCKFCDAQCLTCTDTASNCTTCRGEGRYGSACICQPEKFDIEQGIQKKDCAYQICNVGYYDTDADTCVDKCHPNCIRCSSRGDDACYTCSNSAQFNWRGKCLDSCPIGTKPIVMQNLPKVCIVDNQTSPSDDCPESTFNNGTNCIKCINGCSKCDDQTSCRMCLKGFFLQGNICVACSDQNCSTNQCDGINRDPNKNCICKDGFKDITDTNIKIKDCFLLNNPCQTGKYQSQTEGGICKICNERCLECYENSENNCLKCPTNLFFYYGKCVQYCPQDTFQDSVNSACIDCKSNPSKCASCSSDQYYDVTSQKCTQCPSKCKGCSSDKQCLKCSEGKIEPNCECPSGKYNDQQGICQTCNANCSLCSNSTTCSQCKGDNRDSGQVCSCKQGYIDTIGNAKLTNCIMIPTTNCNTNQYFNQASKSCQSCNQNCQTCYGPSINQCLTCQYNLYYYLGTCVDNCLDNTILNQQNLTCEECKTDSCQKCSSGQYRDANQKCQPCQMSCGTCTDGNSCQTCLDGIQRSDCTSCQAGSYKDSQGLCVKCNMQCAECKDKSDQCTKCNGTNRDIAQNCKCKVDYTDTINGVSVIDCIFSEDLTYCENGQYYESKKCVQCDVSCYTCYGAAKTNCASCMQGGECLNECPIQTFFDVKKGVCQDCTSTGQCLSNQCKLDEYYDMTKRMCMKCPKQCSGCSNKNTCILCASGRVGNNCASCEIGLYLDSVGICSKCDSKCSSCSASSNACTSCKGDNRSSSNNCECNQGYIDVVGSNILEDCIKQPDQTANCGQGKFKKDSNCLACNDSCKDCFGPTVAQCTSCAQNLIFYKGGCVTKCPQSTQLDTIKNICVECTGGDCAKQCQQGQYFDFDKQVCAPCKKECATCESLQVCSDCAAGRGGYNCTGCENGKYLDAQGLCRSCDPKCLTCKTFSTNCDACSGNNRSDIKNQCDCIQGYTDAIAGGLKVKDCFIEINQGCQTNQFFDNGCKACHLSCKECYGPSESQCKSCKDEYYIYNGRCIQECPSPYIVIETEKKCTDCIDPAQCQKVCAPGQFYDSIQRGCFPCRKGCLSCQSLDVCNKCQDDRYGDQCQITNDGMFINPKGETQLCKNVCATCVSESQCTSCRGNYRNLTTCQCLEEYTDIVDGKQTINCINKLQEKRCPTNQYVANNRCNVCHISCQECTGATEKDCTSCSAQLLYMNGQCVSQCPISMKFDKVTLKCIECLNNECISCEKEQFFDLVRKECLPCDKKCDKCQGSSDNCTACSHFRKGADCEECIDGYYKDEFGVCNLCDVKCDSCDKSSSQCTKCSGNNRNQQTCLCVQPFTDYYQISYSDCFIKPPKSNTCKNNEFYNGVSCEICSTSCNKCYGKSLNQCLTCNKPLLLQGSQCVTKCDDKLNYIKDESNQSYCKRATEKDLAVEKTCDNGEYYNKELRGCYKCDTKCSSCSISSSNCESCAGNRIQNDSCSQCNDGLYENASGECLPCDYKCAKCSQKSTQCTVCKGLNRMTEKENCVCQDGFSDSVGKVKQIDCINPSQIFLPKPVIILDKSTQKLGENHYSFKGQITFNTNVNIMSFKEWQIIIDSIDQSKVTTNIIYTQAEDNLALKEKHVFNFEVQIFSELKNDNLPNMKVLFPNSYEVQDEISQELSSKLESVLIPQISLVIEKPIINDKKGQERSDRFELIPHIQSLILLGLCLPSQFHAFALSLDILQMLNQAQFFNIKLTPLLEDVLIGSDFSNFRFFPIYNSEHYDVPNKFREHKIQSTFIFNIIQPLSIWAVSLLVYLVCKTIKCTSKSVIFRLIQEYKNSYFYFIVSGVGLITFTKSLESTLLQLRDISNLDNTLVLISYILSSVSVFYYAFYVYTCYKSTQLNTVDVYDNHKLFSKYSFYYSGLKGLNKFTVFYLVVVVRKFLYTLSVVFFFDDPVKQVGFCNFIVGMETLILLNIQPFQKTIEQKLHIWCRIFLIITLGLMYALAFDDQANLFGETALNIISYMTITFVLLNYFIQVIYNCFISYKKLKQKVSL